MAYTTPRTWTDGELVNKSIMDVHVRDNFVAVHGGALGLTSQASGKWMQATSAGQFGIITPYSPWLYFSAAAGGNVGLGVDMLQQYALTAGLLGTDGWGLEVMAAVTFAAVCWPSLAMVVMPRMPP